MRGITDASQAFYSKYLIDMAHSQNYSCAQNPRACARLKYPQDAIGAISDVVPYDTIGQFPGTVVWQLAYVIITRNVWWHYADEAVVQQHYPNLIQLMASIQRLFVNATTGLADLDGHGDW
eukprot:SAG25_NODE_213_length_11711_cov_8.330348_11_plen_121_part_00